jgi:hypothetical protein
MGNYLIYGLIFTMLERLTNMTKYEMQYEIFKMMKDLYPSGQLDDVDAYVRKLWNKDESTLLNLYNSWKAITNE